MPMLNKSRPQGATDGGRRRYDVPGASLRGPYKLWIPKTDNRHSESETEGIRPAPSRHHGPTSRVTAGSTAAAPLTPSARHTNTTSTQHAASAPHKQRTERTPLGYASEASTHAPPNPSKPSSSFSLFKPHTKEPRGHSDATTRREEVPRSTTASATVSSRHTASQPISVPQKSASRNAPLQEAEFSSLSTPSSTDPSPKSSTDSSPRNGHVLTTGAGHPELRKQNHSIWNPYVDARVDRTSASRRNETPSAPPRRDERKAKDKEDMVARVTEALGGGSTGKAKAAETALLYSQVQTVKRDEGGSTRKRTPSIVPRGAEPSSQPQASQSRRHKATPYATPLPPDARLPDNMSKNLRPSASSRDHFEGSSRFHGPSEPSTKVPSSHQVPPSASSKLSHLRSASSPWPFNQALPQEQAVSSTKPPTHSLWNQSFTRFQGSSTQQTPESRPPPKESTQHLLPHGDDFGPKSQQVHTPSPAPLQQSSKSPSPRSTQPPSANTALTTTTQMRTNPSYTSTSTEPQRWSPNTLVHGRPAPGPSNGAHQSHNTLQTPMPTTSKLPESSGAPSPALEPPEPTPATNRRNPADGMQSNVVKYPEPSKDLPLAPEPTPALLSTTYKRYAGDGTQSTAASVWIPPATPQRSRTASSAGLQSHSESRTPWPATSSYPERNDVVGAHEPVPVGNGRYLTTSMSLPPDAPIQATGRSVSTSTTNPLWPTTPRHAEVVNIPSIADEPAPANGGRNVANDSLAMTVPAAGTWTSKYTQDTYPTSDYETDDAPEETMPSPAHQITNSSTNMHPPNPPQQLNATTNPDNLAPGAWTSRYATANMSISKFETPPAPKPPLKTPSSEVSTSTAFKYASAASSAPEATSRGLRYATTNTVPINQQAVTAPGAWTTSTRFGSNTAGSIFDSTSSTKGASMASRENSTRQATLGTTPVAGAWTTKQTPENGSPSSSEATVKQTSTNHTPPLASNTPSSSSLLKPPASGTNTGTSTPSSTQISDIINQLSPVTSHSISTRVPISGHPSTPAPVRPTLRPTPPPLSISSTSPDTDSLLTPSSLNSPRSTIALPQLQPVSTITGADVLPPERESAPRKTGFFDFLRPKPTLKSYEVWTPPARPKEKERTREEQPKQPSPPPAKPKQSAPVSIPPRPKSPKFFSPFKLFSKRHRTVSSASLDVLDGTAPNTVLNSPASSMRADTPGAPPSPPLRDAFLATQEWRNREATELVVSGRKRRHRPGVTFDCPEDVAPVDILPSRLRIGRIQNDDDDEYQ